MNDNSCTERFKIPDLSELHNIGVSWQMHRIFNSAGPNDHRQLALISNFIRVVDLSIHEYQNGRNSIFKFWKTRDHLAISELDFACAYFERCITSVKRSINILNAIKGSKIFPTDVSRDFKSLLPQHLSILKGYAKNKITDMRDAIQHLEGDIKVIKIGQPMLIEPKINGLELSGIHISYNELSVWLKELHECASKFYTFYTKDFPRSS